VKIAIIGSGIAGLTSAYLLSRRHDITLFEAGDRIGGHTHTVNVTVEGKAYAVDTGFIVFNDWTYPNFIRLLGQIGVTFKPTEMSFSVCDQSSGFESLAIPLFEVARYRTATKFEPGGPMVRFHIGLEDVGDLIADLERGFAALAAAR